MNRACATADAEAQRLHAMRIADLVLRLADDSARPGVVGGQNVG